MSDPRRRIPAVDTLLASAPFAPLLGSAGRARVAARLRAVQEELRDRLAAGAGGQAPADPEWYAARVREALDAADRPSLLPVINATGVVLHTNLGRAPLAESARRAVEAAAEYAALEYDLETGDRGSRYDHCVGLLRELTGAEDALVVNNNAGALVLGLNTLAEGRGVVVSRGELVEIGGSFRVPEILARSGARMREVGATNRTHPDDYRAALGEDVAVLLKVHRSNFRVEGFTAEVPAAELASIAAEAGVGFIHDLGSGALIDTTTLGLPAEPTAAEAVAAGTDLVTLSGDKLLGGPQAGIIAGRAEPVAALRANPLCRALRPDKLTLAALEATLALYLDPDRARREIPVLRMLGADADHLAARAQALADRITRAGVPAATVPVNGAVGGGALPGVELKGTAVALEAHGGAEALARRLRGGRPPVVGRIHEGRVLLDPRTVPARDEDVLVAAVLEAAGTHE